MTADEMVAKIATHLRDQPQARFSLFVYDGEFGAAYEWGKEAPDSPMYGAASYGNGPTLEDALATIIEEARLS